jgi:5-methylthioadenosine/S-adenosylhomocysteine deaminase
LHMAHKTGSLEPGKHADLIMVNMQEAHSWPQFQHHPEAVYSRLVYAAKSGDVQDVMCHGRWLMRGRELLTVDEAEVTAATIPLAQKIDAFVRERESSPYNKLLALGTLEREEGYEAQIKVRLNAEQAESVRTQLASGQYTIQRTARALQYDNYLLFDTPDVEANRLRFREEAFVQKGGSVQSWRTRLTLLGEARHSFLDQIILSRSRFWATANQTLRFYREYFMPQREVEIHKERERWVMGVEGVELAVNLDQIIKPQLDGYFLEIKASTWSRPDAQHKAKLIEQVLAGLGLGQTAVLDADYIDLV